LITVSSLEDRQEVRLINQAGKVVIKPEFDLTFNFSEGLAFVEKDGSTAFTRAGEMVIEPQFITPEIFKTVWPG
jgi:hypothetical protein